MFIILEIFKLFSQGLKRPFLPCDKSEFKLKFRNSRRVLTKTAIQKVSFQQSQSGELTAFSVQVRMVIT
jgi:hypothetical protein